jgi:hypothetical protein
MRASYRGKARSLMETGPLHNSLLTEPILVRPTPANSRSNNKHVCALSGPTGWGARIRDAGKHLTMRQFLTVDWWHADVLSWANG